MFLEPSRVPAADHAYEEGKMDSMQGKTAKPSYDPSTEQYRMYMQGFHDDTARRVKEGIKKPTEPKVGDKKVITKAEKEAAAKPAPEAPKSGVAMTRSEFMAQQAAKKAEAAPDPRVAAESVFKKKGAAAASN